MQIKDMDELKEQVKAYLPEYLERFGRKVNKGNFACPNESAHQNQQKEPTAGFADKVNHQVWKCFGCGEKGDIFHASVFLEGRDIQGQGFIETLIYLADLFNIHYEQDERQEDILKLHEHIVQVVRIRKESKKAIEFLQNRKLLEAVKIFELGYCTWEGLKKHLIKHFDLETVNLNVESRIFDDRLIIPIRNENGQLVGFAGRTLVEEKPKYRNSSKSSMYQKGSLLYNLHRVKGNEIYIVEGYADVWRLHLNGYPVAATCGTALTTGHLNLLYERGFKKITLCYDGDGPGIEAKERAKKIISADSRFEFSTMLLPNGKDPDEIIKEQGKEAFEQVKRELIKKPIDSLLSWTADKIMDFEERLEEGEEDGYKIGWEMYMKHMDGVKKGLHLVGGLSNVGKTSFMLEIYKQLAIYNHDLVPVFFTIDDDWEVPYLRMLASGLRMPIGDVRNHKRTYERLKKISESAADDFVIKRTNEVGRIFSLVKQAPIYDITKASKLAEFEHVVKTIKEYTGKNVAMFVDNFHKIRDDGFNTTNERFTRISEELKRITIEHGLVTFATVELRKLNHNGRPSLDDIKESVDIIYDANVVYMLHNDLHSKQGDTELKFDDNGVTYPIIEMSIPKNKLSSFKGKIYYRFIPEQAYYKECLPSEQKEWSQKEIKRGYS